MLRQKVQVDLLPRIGAERGQCQVGEVELAVFSELRRGQLATSRPAMKRLALKAEGALEMRGVGEKSADTALARVPEIVQAHGLSGSIDLLARVACRGARALGAAHVVLAVPVASRTTVDSMLMSREADEIEVLATPRGFRAVGAHYRDFAAVDDETVAAILARGT